jgi:hypothetical protein
MSRLDALEHQIDRRRPQIGRARMTDPLPHTRIREALEAIQLHATNHGGWVESDPWKGVCHIHDLASEALTKADQGARDAIVYTHALAGWIMANRDNQDMPHRDFRIEVGKLAEAGEMAAFGASDAACYLYPGEDQQGERAAYCQGAHDVALSGLSLPVGDAPKSIELPTDPWERLETIRSGIWAAAAEGLTFGPQTMIAETIEVVLALPADGWQTGNTDTWPDELAQDSDLAFALGRPNFWCGSFAHTYQKAGAPIAKRAEEEQAFIIHRMISFQRSHGDDWREAMANEMRELQQHIELSLPTRDALPSTPEPVK